MRRPRPRRRNSSDTAPYTAADLRTLLNLPAEGTGQPPAPEADAVAALPRPQQVALELLMAGRSARVAAEVVGVHGRTVYRWVHEDPAFRAALALLQDRVRTSTRARLVALTDDAVDVVRHSLRRRGDPRVALTLLRELGMMSPTPSPADAAPKASSPASPDAAGVAFAPPLQVHTPAVQLILTQPPARPADAADVPPVASTSTVPADGPLAVILREEERLLTDVMRGG